MATIAEAARHIDLGERRFFELLDDGVIERKSPAAYDLDEVRVTYIRHVRKVAAGRGAEKGSDLAAERAKLAREQTEIAARRNAVERGELVSIEEVGRQIEEEYGVVRQRLLAIPGTLADSLVSLDRASIESALHEAIKDALTELHDPTDLDGQKK
ncbi:MAG: hypothetical protein ABSA90_04255 [Xanthobacteraceae bacterium]|jgi:phage terminase Nu1 subunit (DNA packaging protein)